MHHGQVDRHHYVVTWVLVIFAAAASLGGLFVNGTYRDNAFVITVFQGNDFVTLFLAIPLIAVSYFLMGHSQRARIVWQGSLLYLVYNYQFYLYGAAFNRFFLVYVTLFTVSLYTLIFALARTDVDAFAWQFSEKTPVRLISGFMMLFALLLGVLWTAMAASTIFTGVIPETVRQTGHPTAVVFATDLTILIPGMGIGGLLLWQRRPWGYLTASIIMVKAATYGISLIVMSAFTYRALGIADPLLLLWSALTLGCIASAWLLLKSIPRTVSPQPGS